MRITLQAGSKGGGRYKAELAKLEITGEIYKKCNEERI
jgi:hypothetical protein